MDDLKAAISAVADQPQPQSRIDLDRAMVEGRALRRRRQAITSAVAGLAVLAVAGGAALGAVALNEPATPQRPPGYGVAGQPGPCQVAELASPADVPAGMRFSVTDIDPTGRYVTGAGIDGAQQSVAVLWDNGRPTVISVPGSDVSTAVDVNRHGVVVGESDQGPWRYRDGQVTFLPRPDGGGATVPVAINDAGDIVGNWDRNSGLERESRPVLWPIDKPGTVVELPGRGSEPKAEVTGVAEDGTVVGIAPDPNEFANLLVLWRDGEPVTLGGPGRRDSAQVSGQWVLDVASPFGGGTPQGTGTDIPEARWLWDLTSGESYELDAAVRAMNVNARGVVVGFIGSVAKRDGTTPVVVRNGKPITLPEPPGRNAWPMAISDNGVIVGTTASKDKGRIMALIWTGC